MLEATAELLSETPEFPLYEAADFADDNKEVYYALMSKTRDYEITRDDDASWILSERNLKNSTMTNFDHDESVLNLPANYGMGIDEDLQSWCQRW